MSFHNYGTTEARANAILIEDAALAMRAKGKSPEEIAVALNTTRDKIGKALSRAMKRYQTQVRESCEYLVTLEEIRLDEMFARIHPNIGAGQLEAIALGLKIMERRAKLRGLDAPAKVQNSTAPAEVPLGHLTVEELRQISATLDKAQPLSADEDSDPAYLDGAKLPDEIAAASGPTAIAPERPRVVNPLDDRL